jgi:hypothetical protein
MNKTFIKNAWTCSIIWGLIGAILTIASNFLPFDATWKKEICMMIVFVISLIGLLYTVRVRQNKKKFIIIFLAALLTWMTVPIVVHVIRAIQLGGYNFRWVTPFFQMLGLGIIFCAPLAWLTIQLRKSL